MLRNLHFFVPKCLAIQRWIELNIESFNIHNYKKITLQLI